MSRLIIPVSHLDTLACRGKKGRASKERRADGLNNRRSWKLKCRVRLQKGKKREIRRQFGWISKLVSGGDPVSLDHQECFDQNTGSQVREVSKTVQREGSITLLQPCQVAPVWDRLWKMSVWSRVQVKDRRCLLFAALASYMWISEATWCLRSGVTVHVGYSMRVKGENIHWNPSRRKWEAGGICTRRSNTAGKNSTRSVSAQPTYDNRLYMRVKCKFTVGGFWLFTSEIFHFS